MTAKPEWLADDIEALHSSDVLSDAQATAAFLSATRDQMHHSFATFQSHLRNTGYLIGVLLVGAGAMAAIALEGDDGSSPNRTFFAIGSAAVLVAIVPVSALAIAITAQVFRLYAGAVVYAAQAHAAAGVASHPWFDFVFSYPEATKHRTPLGKALDKITTRALGPSPTPRTALMDSWVQDPSSVFTPFVLMLLVVDVFCLVGAVAVLVLGI